MDSDINVPVDQGSVYMEFRAGRMFMEGNKVVPDTRKGMIRMNLGADRLFRFQWLDRTRNVIEYTVILEGEPENSGIPPSFEEIQDHILSRDRNLVVPALGGEGSSVVTSTLGPVKLEDLQRILNNIGPEVAAEDPDEGLGLGDILKPDLILPLIETLSVQESFAAYLPEGYWSAEELMDLLQSPPFRQQVDSFTYVLRTGQIDLTQFGIDPSKYKFTVMSFLEALEDSVSIASPSSNEPMDESQ